MNKNGFTLVELIITIGLLSLLGVLIANNMVNIQGKQLQKNYENYKKEIAAAACLAIESEDVKDLTKELFFKKDDFLSIVHSKNECIINGECFIKTGTLLELGYLNKELENPATGKLVTNDEIARVRYIAGEKTCDYYSYE